MDRNAEEASGGRQGSVVILSGRSREIIRLVEELQRKRQPPEQDRLWDGGGKGPGTPSQERHT